jgi:hypothetical protein
MNKKKILLLIQLNTYTSILVVQYYGITQNPDNGDYAIVMQYAKDGDLRQYLSWYAKNQIIYEIEIM